MNEVTAIVIRSKDHIGYKYKYGELYFVLEVPITPENDDLKAGQQIRVVIGILR